MPLVVDVDLPGLSGSPGGKPCLPPPPGGGGGGGCGRRVVKAMLVLFRY